MKSVNQIDQNLIDKIISVAYGSAGFIDRLRIYFYSLKNPEIKQLLNEYKQTADVIHSINNLKCPDKIVEEANKIIQKENRPKRFSIFDQLFSKPIIATVSAVIIVSVIGIFIFKKQSVKTAYSKAEVEIAEKQVKQSLALVGKVFRSTENTLTEEIIKKQVTPPFQKSLETVNSLFKGG